MLDNSDSLSSASLSLVFSCDFQDKHPYELFFSAGQSHFLVPGGIAFSTMALYGTTLSFTVSCPFSFNLKVQLFNILWNLLVSCFGSWHITI